MTYRKTYSGNSFLPAQIDNRPHTRFFWQQSDERKPETALAQDLCSFGLEDLSGGEKS